MGHDGAHGFVGAVEELDHDGDGVGGMGDGEAEVGVFLGGADGEFVGEGFVEVSVDVVDGEGVDGESVFLPGPSVKVHCHSHIRVGDVGLHGL